MSAVGKKDLRPNALSCFALSESQVAVSVLGADGQHPEPYAPTQSFLVRFRVVCEHRTEHMESAGQVTPTVTPWPARRVHIVSHWAIPIAVKGPETRSDLLRDSEGSIDFLATELVASGASAWAGLIWSFAVAIDTVVYCGERKRWEPIGVNRTSGH